MEVKIFMLLVLLLGVAGFYRGVKQIKRNTGKSNLLDAIFSSFLGTFQYSGIGKIAFGLLLIALALIFLIR